VSIPDPARSELHRALTDAARARRSGDLPNTWVHLERAHVLSQPWAWPHIRVHAAMLRTAAAATDLREIGGQLTRLAVAAPGSWSGRYPSGNSGRARVSMFAPMNVPDDLESILDRST
jgi:hypothetical protein